MRLVIGLLTTLFCVISYSQALQKNINKQSSIVQEQDSPNKLKINSNNIYKDNDLSLLIPKKKSGKFGFINKQGVTKIPHQYSSVTFFTEDCNLKNSPNPKIRKFGSEEFATVEKNNQQFRINKKGQLVYQYKDSDLGKCKGIYITKPYHAYVLNGMYGVIEDATFENPADYKQYKIYPQYDYLYILESKDIRNPMIVASKNNRFGILDISGKIIVPFEYTDIKRNYSWKQAELFEVTKDDVNYFYIDVYNKAY